MKKLIISLILIVIIISSAWVIYVKYPRNIDLELTGVKYQLGSEGAKLRSEPATVVIKGKLHKSFRSERVFKGYITIVGEEIPVPKDQRKLEIHFSSDDWGVMAYPYVIFDKYGEQGSRVKPMIYQSHIIFANKDFSQVTLLLKTPDQQSEYKNGASQSVWNAENGKMLSAPASTREEALALSNKLMREYLNPYGEFLK